MDFARRPSFNSAATTTVQRTVGTILYTYVLVQLHTHDATQRQRHLPPKSTHTTQYNGASHQGCWRQSQKHPVIDDDRRSNQKTMTERLTYRPARLRSRGVFLRRGGADGLQNQPYGARIDVACVETATCGGRQRSESTVHLDWFSDKQAPALGRPFLPPSPALLWPGGDNRRPHNV